jgi:hypothetical protein
MSIRLIVLLGLVLSVASCAKKSAEQGAVASDARATLDEKQAPVEVGRMCATEEPDAALRRRIATDLRAFRNVNAGFRARELEIAIPVHFHVIHSGNQGKLTDQQVADQMRALNEGFKNTGFRFTLASKDWTDNADWFAMRYRSANERAAKRQLGKDVTKALNLYTANLSGGLLGWATFPADLSGDPERDGVVIKYDTVPGGGSARFGQGKTAVHETAHWLGLYHTFQEGCSEPGDEVDDTPYEKTPATGKPGDDRDTCPHLPGRDPIHNFMDYCDDEWLTHFTSLQVVRMKEQVALYRTDLMDLVNAKLQRIDLEKVPM